MRGSGGATPGEFGLEAADVAAAAVRAAALHLAEPGNPFPIGDWDSEAWANEKWRDYAAASAMWDLYRDTFKAAVESFARAPDLLEENERLTAALRDKADAYQMTQKNYEDAIAGCKRFRAENERLRAALRRIAEDAIDSKPQMRLIARAALEGGK